MPRAHLHQLEGLQHEPILTKVVAVLEHDRHLCATKEMTCKAY